MIEVKKVGSNNYQVTVNGPRSTTHSVTLEDSYYQKLSAGQVTPEQLIENSFEFLLERESNTSILSSFDLPLIGTYFPEYERTIKGRLP